MHAAHHGGAWKVAYADFVTAMMALFIVLWLVNMSKPVREAIAGYFKDPSSTADLLGTNVKGPGEHVVVATTKDDMSKLKEELEKQSGKCPTLTNSKTKSKSRLHPKACGSSSWNLLPALFSTAEVPSPTRTGNNL